VICNVVQEEIEYESIRDLVVVVSNAARLHYFNCRSSHEDNTESNEA
jgi:hypothetical protein